MYLVGYDVLGVHSYVFEPVRPMDVMGGSLLLEHFAQEARKLANSRGVEVVTSAGGAGLFRAPAEEVARELARDLKGLLKRLTAGGARCTTAWVQEGTGFPEARRKLRSELRKARFEQELGQPAPVLVPQGTWPRDVCQACGREPASVEDVVGDELERIGERCKARRQAGRGRSPTIGEVLGGSGGQVPRGAVLAAVYLDGDAMGSRLDSLSTPEELRSFSSDLEAALRAAIADVQSALAPLQLVQVAMGGDDLLVFCDARRVLELLAVLWECIADGTRGLGVSFSTGVVVGEPLLPLRLYFQEAEAALREAKALSRSTGKPHVGVRGLMAGTRHGRRGDLFGGPLSQKALGSAEGIRRVMRALAELPPAQLAGLADDLALPSREEALLAVEYRARSARDAPEAGGGTLRAAVEWARELAGRDGRPGAAPELDLLSGSLVFASFGG